MMSDFDNIYGYDAAKRELRQMADFLRDPDSYQKTGSRMLSGLMIVGRPGLGKTLMAQALMRESGLAAFTCRKSARGEDMLKAIRKAFDDARKSAPSVLLLDDLDKFSNSGYDHRDTEEYVTVQSCIDQCKGKGVFVIATANDEGKLPKSLMRAGRFDRTITLDAPRGDDAVAVVGHYLAGIACGPDAIIENVTGVLEGSSCAFIETVVNEASLLAGFEGEDHVGMIHFIRAYAKSRGDGALSRLSEDEPSHIEDAWASPRAQVAFHEAGHFVMRELLNPGGAALALIVERQGRLSGFTKDRHAVLCDTAEEARANILVALAGGVAVEQQYGIPCMGSSSDNEAAVEMVTNLISDAGSLGRYYTGSSQWLRSEFLCDAREQARAVMLEQFRWEVRNALAKRRSLVESVASKLYRSGYVLASDLDAD